MSKVGFTGLPPLQESGTVHGHHNPSPFPLPQNLQVHPTSSNPNPSTTGSSAKQQNYGLHHLETNWPGETGNGHHLDVIPGNGKQLLCLDGQQRITTTTLLLAAIRPHCRRANMGSTVSKIDGLLFGGPENSEKIHQWAQKQAASILQSAQESSDVSTDQEMVSLESFTTGWLPQSTTEFQTTLVPSYIDRAAYFEILSLDPIQQALEGLLAMEENKDKESKKIHLEFSSTTKESTQYMTYSTFLQLAKNLLKPASANGDFNSNVLSKLFYNQVHRFSMTYIELLTKNDNLQQIFLWMQEKSVFGSGRLLFNPHPGIDFAPVDLARNWIISSAMDLPLQEQVEFYTRCWIQPLEGRCKDTGVLGDILLHLVNRIDQESKGKDRHIGSMEEKLNYRYYRSVSPPALQRMFTDEMPMMVYGRFHSYVQCRATQLGSDPDVISRQLADVIVQELVQEGEKMEVLMPNA
ncbi:unnamed protein product [Cylindrotheca closterium]|uniref:DUF262 domain-containing protein n=1 Tax=Cylindrotheca closterium TaxID=2856 RepID=A0AAD2G3G5_9STRA|nr:unnamed protein product [Cylindrotheca closterium]